MKITVENDGMDLIRPEEMLNTSKYPHGTVFQQYSNGVPQDWFYVTCGYAEPNVITLWYDDETSQYRFSTENYHELSQLLSHVNVKINTDIRFTIEQ